MRLILFIKLLNLKCPEVLTHPQGHPLPAGNLLSLLLIHHLSCTLSIHLPDDVPFYLVLVIPVKDGGCKDAVAGITASFFP